MVSIEAAFGLESVSGIDTTALSAATQQRQLMREQVRQAQQAASQATDPAVAAYLQHVANVLQAGAEGQDLDRLQQELDNFAQFAKQHPELFNGQVVQFVSLVNSAITVITQAATAISNITDVDSAVAAAGTTGQGLYTVGIAFALAGFTILLAGGPLGPFIIGGGIAMAGAYFQGLSALIKDLVPPDQPSTPTTPSTQLAPDSDGDPTGDPDGDSNGDPAGESTDTPPATDSGDGTLQPVDGDSESQDGPRFETRPATSDGGDAGGGSDGVDGSSHTEVGPGTDSFGNPEAQEQFTDDD